MIRLIDEFWREEDGQDLVEYSLLLAFVGLAAVGLLQSAKTSINTIWSRLSTALVNASAS